MLLTLTGKFLLSDRKSNQTKLNFKVFSINPICTSTIVIELAIHFGLYMIALRLNIVCRFASLMAVTLYRAPAKVVTNMNVIRGLHVCSVE